VAENPRTTPGVKAALTIGGSDSSGGAGIEAHLKTFAIMDTFGCAAITAITAQNTTGVKHAHLLEPGWIVEQIDAVAGDINLACTVTGMLGNAESIEAVVGAIKRHRLFPLVVDPVMVAKGGDSLLESAAVKALCRKLAPLAAVITPNGHEAAKMLGRGEPITQPGEAATAARQICRQHKANACIITGLHRPDDEEGEALDVFFDGEALHELTAAWRETKNTHGAGCTFAAALAAGLAHGHTPLEAAQTAKNVVSEAIRQATDLGAGHSPVNHAAWAKVKR